MDTISTPIHNAYKALTGQVPSSRSTGVGVDRCDNSPSLYHCGGGPGKSNSDPSPQQRKPDECGRGRLVHVYSSVQSSLVRVRISWNLAEASGQCWLCTLSSTPLPGIQVA